MSRHGERRAEQVEGGEETHRADVGVVGAGFGGLAAALSLAERGADVVVFERLTYPGGCASTFERKGWRFESGATLFAGLEEDQLFGRWIDRYDLDVDVRLLDPVVEMRTDRFDLDIPRDREAFVDEAVGLPGVDETTVRDVFGHQADLADALWELFDDPDLLPPFGMGELLRHVKRTPSYLGLLRWMGSSLGDFLAAYGADESVLETYFDAVCQITVQTDAAEAEAPFALAATDYFFRGAGHVDGGIGELAEGLVEAVEGLGGEVHLADPVQSIERRGEGWRVGSRLREVAVDRLVGGVTPGVLVTLLEGDESDVASELEELDEEVRTGWGAAMLYLGLAPDAPVPEEPHHYQVVADSSRPLKEGNHVFCSVSGAHERDRAPNGERTVTCSTHVDMGELLARDEEGRAEYVERIQQRMRQTLRLRVPEVAESVVMEMTASPRTFERFTGRPDGFVGGVPRRVGWHNYKGMRPTPVGDRLYLVGDSVFPGQSTLACAVGGRKVAERVERDARGFQRSTNR